MMKRQESLGLFVGCCCPLLVADGLTVPLKATSGIRVNGCQRFSTENKNNDCKTLQYMYFLMYFLCFLVVFCDTSLSAMDRNHDCTAVSYEATHELLTACSWQI